MKAVCEICPRHCALAEGETGFCRARGNKDGAIVCVSYGMLTALALDPIEKKPLRRFFPGSKILSVGSFGCNLRCPFCQNSDIAAAGAATARAVFVPPGELVQKAMKLVSSGNIGLAYTYNEPLIGYEYVRDCASLAHGEGLKNVIVTNGMICREPLKELLPLIDAMNIDLKAFTESFYHAIGGSLGTVKDAIELASKRLHVEVTTLIIPGENDSEAEMRELSGWLGSISPQISLHISRFFPRYQMADREATPVETVYALADIARKRLSYVYTGNC